MSADWIKGYDPNQLAHRLERAKKLNPQTNNISSQSQTSVTYMEWNYSVEHRFLYVELTIFPSQNLSL